MQRIRVALHELYHKIEKNRGGIKTNDVTHSPKKTTPLVQSIDVTL
jgi:hypothetical protein